MTGPITTWATTTSPATAGWTSGRATTPRTTIPRGTAARTTAAATAESLAGAGRQELVGDLRRPPTGSSLRSDPGAWAAGAAWHPGVGGGTRPPGLGSHTARTPGGTRPRRAGIRFGRTLAKSGNRRELG